LEEKKDVGVGGHTTLLITGGGRKRMGLKCFDITRGEKKGGAAFLSTKRGVLIGLGRRKERKKNVGVGAARLRKKRGKN